MKRLVLVLISVLGIITTLTPAVSAQPTLSQGFTDYSFLTTTITPPQAGTVFALPSRPITLNWTTTYSAAPGSVTIDLQISNTTNTDAEFLTISSSTLIAGEVKVINGLVGKFIRARVSAKSGGGTVTSSFNIGFGIVGLSSAGGTLTGPLLLPDGTAAAPALAFANDPDSGLIRNASGYQQVVLDGVPSYEYSKLGRLNIGISYLAGGPTLSSTDAYIRRFAAAVWAVTSNSGATGGLIGGGTAVASAAAMPLPTGAVFHVTGTTAITSITSTNFAHGACITLIFDGILNFTDGGNLKLASTMATTADDTISLCYDGTNWYETARSVN